MPIDDIVLGDKIKELLVKADACQKKYQDFMMVIGNLRSIERKGGELPQDARTFKAMSPTTRQEIYDENVALGDTLPQ